MEIQSSSTVDVFNQTTPVTSSVVDTGTSSSGDTTSSSSVSQSSSQSNSESNSSSVNTSTTSDSGSAFSAFLKAALGGESKTQVSEEELFAGLVGQKLTSKSEEAGQFYAQEKAKLMQSMAHADGYISYEQVALTALNNAVAAGAVSKEDAEMINGEAFAGAQLDSNLDSLYDDRGSENDPTKAVASMSDALMKAEEFMNSVSKGEKTVEARSLESGTTGQAGSQASNGSISTGAVGSGASGAQALDGSGGFLWKPVSESDGKLAILLPQAMAGMVERLEIHSSLPPEENSKIATGNYKYDSNGGRPTFRFDKPGDAYGNNVFVVAQNKDGTTASWAIPDGGARND